MNLEQKPFNQQRRNTCQNDMTRDSLVSVFVVCARDKKQSESIIHHGKRARHQVIQFINM